MPSDMPYRCEFGSWGNALVEAGFQPTKFMPPGKMIGVRNKVRKRIINVHGYVEIYEPSHPLAKKNGYVAEHRMIVWDVGLMVDRKMSVHHRNEIKTDNRLNNLVVLDRGEHTSHHFKGAKVPRSGSTPCKVDGCITLQKSKYEMCRKHYKQAWSVGNIYENPELLK